MASVQPGESAPQKLGPPVVSSQASVEASPAGAGWPTAAVRSDYPKQVPADRAVRSAIRERAWQVAASWDRTGPLSRQQIQDGARQILAELGLPEDYLGWTMVMVGSAFWEPQVAAVPVERRLLLLPHCFRDSEKCQGHYTAQELLCRDCGACRLSFFRAEAQRLGYQVLIAEGTPIVVEMILHGRVDAILGVACLNSLERALDKILQVGIPCMAVPLWESRCRDSQTDEDWVLAMLRTPYIPAVIQKETYLHLLRASTELFRPDRLARFLPRFPHDSLFPVGADSRSAAVLAFGGPRAGSSHFDTGAADGAPVWEATERLAWDFLLRGGKHLRPFLTLAAYDAMTGAQATGPHARQVLETWPAAVWQLALAIELFHKASLVHDDIEDDDPYRYGQPALHRQYGVPMALNVGDFLIGWGYRLAAEAVGQMAPETAADILAHLAQAHVRLSEGQGAELAWRQRARKELSALEVLKIYALKTAPAFEAALYGGLRMAGPTHAFEEILGRYSRHLGVAFQIQNDLADWTDDARNKRTIGTDVLSARPTILWALARQGLAAEEAGRLDRLLAEAARFWQTGRAIREHGEIISAGLGDPPLVARPMTDAPRMPDARLRRERLTGTDSVPEPFGSGALPGPPPAAPHEHPLPEANLRSHPYATFSRANPGQDGPEATACRQQTEALLAEVRRLYEKADAFGQAEALVQKHRERAHQLADQVGPAPLKRLLHYVADMVIHR